nr:TorF family putative porin [Parafrankia sp. BMG5.11]
MAAPTSLATSRSICSAGGAAPCPKASDSMWDCWAGIDAEYFEPYATVSGDLGPVSAKFGVNYAWDQKGLADDNLYLHTELSSAIPTTPLTLSAHLGYTDGSLAPTLLAGTGDDSAFDWSVGASATVLGSLTLGVSYVGVEGPSIDGLTDDAVVVSLGASF